MAGARYPPVTGPPTVASPGSPTTVAQEASSVVSFLANVPEMLRKPQKTVAVEGDKQHSEIWKSKVYLAPVRAQRSHLQSLSTRSLFWVTFIQYRLPSLKVFPRKQPLPSPFLAQTEFLPKKLISNAWSTISRAASKDIRHVVAGRLQEGSRWRSKLLTGT